MFTQAFDNYACEGDSIECEVDGVRYVARIEFDPDSSPLDYMDADADHVLIDAWKNDEWFFCGIVISAFIGDVELTDHASSLWSVECNYPDAATNAYLRGVANEMLGDAQAHVAHLVNSLKSSAAFA